MELNKNDFDLFSKLEDMVILHGDKKVSNIMNRKLLEIVILILELSKEQDKHDLT